MLKLTYTENSFSLEYIEECIENWLKTRLILSLRTANSFYIQPSTACFLLPTDLRNLKQLKSLIQQEDGGDLVISHCDPEYIEVSIQGTWVTSESGESESGVFVTAISNQTELCLNQLWQEAQSLTSPISE